MKLITLLLLIPTIASASIGSSESECVAKYGTNLGGVDPTYGIYTAKKNGIDISAYLRGGKVVMICYSGSFTSENKRYILGLNGSSWTKSHNNKWISRGMEAEIRDGFIRISGEGYMGHKTSRKPVTIQIVPRRLTLRQVGGG